MCVDHELGVRFGLLEQAEAFHYPSWYNKPNRKNNVTTTHLSWDTLYINWDKL
jgi:hypothetical protein